VLGPSQLSHLVWRRRHLNTTMARSKWGSCCCGTAYMFVSWFCFPDSSMRPVCWNINSMIDCNITIIRAALGMIGFLG
jgi:ammonia channel protein AmtB